MTEMTRATYIEPETLAVEAAPGIGRIDVQAVASKEARAAYAARQTIYPKLAHGTFRKVSCLIFTDGASVPASKTQSNLARQ